MDRRLNSLTFVATLLLLAGPAWGDTTWTGGGDGSSWSDAANWGGTPPAGQRRAFINGTATVNIDAAVNDTVNRVILADGANTDEVTVNMTGGSLTIAGGSDVQNLEVGTVGRATFHLSGGQVSVAEYLRIGLDPPPATAVGEVIVDGGTLTVSQRLYAGAGEGSNGTLRVGGNGVVNVSQRLIMGVGSDSTAALHVGDSGVINADQLFLADGVGSTGTLTMTGGTINATSRFWAPTNNDATNGTAHIQLDGGTINAGDFHLTNYAPSNIKGTMDIRGGTLICSGDLTTTLTEYVSNGWLTGYGFADTGHVLIEYNSGMNTTTVTAQADVNCYILTPNLPPGAVGESYSGAFESAPGCTGSQWTVISGQLPDGLTLNSTTGAVTGAPLVSGTFGFTVEMTANEGTRTVAASITVVPGPLLEIAETTDVWIRESSPGAPAYDADRIRVFSSAAGPDFARRWGLVEFDVSSLAGLPIQGASLRLYQPARHDQAMRQSAFLIPSQPNILTATWNSYMVNQDPYKQAFAQFGRFVLAGLTPENQYYESGAATLADVAMIQAEANGDGKLTLVLAPDEDGQPYIREWGDGEYAGEPPLLVVDVGSSCAVMTSALPDASQGAPYMATLQAATGCGSNPTWQITECFLPTGLELDPSTGVISGYPIHCGPFAFGVQVTPSGGGSPHSANLSIDVHCSEADLDDDGDVDPDDFAVFSANYTGPRVASDCQITGADPLVSIPSSAERWVRPSDPNNEQESYENDNVQVFAAATGDQRIGLVEFDVQSLAGQTITAAYLRMRPGYNTGASIKSSAFLIPSGGLPDLTYNTYLATKDPSKQPFEQFGRIVVLHGNVGDEDSLLATAADLQMITNEANSDGFLTLVLFADEDGTSYARKWGDGVFGDKPELIVLAGPPCQIETLTLPAATAGAPYMTTLKASGECTGGLQWQVVQCALPDGLILDPGTGVLSGTPLVGGTFPFQVQLTSAQGTRLRNLELVVTPGGPGDFDTDGDVDLLDFNVLALAYTGPLGPRPICGTVEFASPDTPLPVPDGASVSSVINVPSPVTVGDLNVHVDITHPFDLDVRLVLTSPQGTSVVLKGFDTGDAVAFSPRTYDDEGFAPDEPLSAVDGQTAAGNWTLTASDLDTEFMDYGVLNSWKLILTGQ